MNPLRNGCFLHPLLLSFHLEIAHRKVRNLRIGVNKLVKKASIKINYVKSQLLACLISIIIDAPAVADAVVSIKAVKVVQID